MSRPWKVMPGFSDARGRLSFDNTGTGIPTRSFATEDAARTAAIDAVSGPEGFAAVRLFCTEWDVGTVDEYESTSDRGAYSVRRLDLAALVRHVVGV